MAGLFNRLKVWAGLEVVSGIDLNGEFDNIINNLGPSGMSGWSQTVAQMQIQTSPGSFGSESLPTSTSGELERLRYQISAIIGGPDNVWYDPVTASLSSITKSLGNVSGSSYPNRLVSGAVVSTSQRANFLYPSASTNSVILKATTTPFIYEINGIQYTVNVDTTLTGLAKAPASANTANLNDALQAGANISKITGEGRSYLRLSSVGSNIISSSPYFGAFKIVDSATTEYFVGWITTTSSALTPTSTFVAGQTKIVLSSTAGVMVGQLITDTTTSGNLAAGTYITSVNGTTVGLSSPTVAASGSPDTLNIDANTGLINQCYRGYFSDNAGAPISRTIINNSDVITIMQPTWIFINTAGTLIGSTIQPRFDGNTPLTGTSNQYWYDMFNQTWKQYNGVSWVVANVTLIGLAITDVNNTVGARAFDYYASYSNQAALKLIQQDSNTIINEAPRAEVSVNGNLFQYLNDDLQFVKNSDIESGQSLTASGNAYLYVTEQGYSIISPIYPYDRNFDLRGWYHPYNSWRCVGYAILNGSTNFQYGVGTDQNTLVRTYSAITDKNIGYGAVTTQEIADSAVTPNKLSSPNIVITPSTGASYTNASSGFTTVTNLSGTIVTSGKPVSITFQSDGNVSGPTGIGGTGSTPAVNWQITRGGAAINIVSLLATSTVFMPPGLLNFLDTPSAGTYTYTLQGNAGVGTNSVQYVQMVLREL